MSVLISKFNYKYSKYLKLYLHLSFSCYFLEHLKFFTAVMYTLYTRIQQFYTHICYKLHNIHNFYGGKF